jgi:hypothetical protein
MDAPPNVLECFQQLTNGTDEMAVAQSLQILGASSWTQSLPWTISTWDVIHNCLTKWFNTSCFAGIAAYRLAKQSICPPTWI